MIDSLLVANRGEIACRIFRTARRLGIRTIAVFSDADATARHVREADDAIWIGPAAARESYLNIARLIEAARMTGARAIHPGYGFLSENAEFAQACAAAGLVFVGPPAAAIAAMGSKIVAKARMRAAGVPVLPGYEGTRQDLAHLETEARKAGLPLIIKPAAGGGGKGMRIVRHEADLGEALAAARRLAESSFGNGTLLLERFLPSPRHVEVQVFADTHGNFVHLGDRDCSIQRRHQKVIEEAPAPDLPDDVRARLRAAAVLVAREIGYVGAGTVEFLFDGDEFFFMEMNTRLQVEHTVTEAVTGLDLVEWQLRVADGERLPLTQREIQLRGHAIEARVCAEDPERDFLPSAGELRLMEWPAGEQRPGGESIRVDAGFASGDTVPATYDSLLGKVIAWAPTRTRAAAALADALIRTYSAGVHTNEKWLARILRTPSFLEVRHSIAFLQEHAGEGELSHPHEPDAQTVALAALIAHAALAKVPPALAAPPSRADLRAHAPASPWGVSDGFTPNLPATVGLALSYHARMYAAEIGFERGVANAVTVAGPLTPDAQTKIAVTDVSIADSFIAARVGGTRVRARYLVDGSHLHVWMQAEHHDFIMDDPRAKEFSATASHGGLTTPLPGVVATVAVEVGAKVAAGDVLMVIEAMKMEHTITAPYEGTVQAIHFARGERVPEGSELLELLPVHPA